MRWINYEHDYEHEHDKLRVVPGVFWARYGEDTRCNLNWTISRTS